MRLVVGISGASGVIYGVRFLEVLKDLKIESELILTSGAKQTLVHEMGIEASKVEKLATRVYDEKNLAASPASGSYKTDGMVVVPCSMKTLAGIASGYSDNLLLRAADVTLKQGRRLVLVPRETPLNRIHLENLLKAHQAGAIILPAMPGFYHRPKDLQDLIDHVIGKILDAFEIEHNLYRRWMGK